MDMNSSDQRSKPDRGRPDRSQPDRIQPDPGQPDVGQPDVGQPDVGQPDPGQPDRGEPHRSAPDHGDADSPAGNSGEAGDDRLDPAHLPRLGQRLALRVLHFFGWTMRFRPLPGPRGIVVVYPHTSNWDFVIGLVAKWAMDLPFRWLAKDSMFRTPLLGRWFRWLGGQPVDRSAPQGMIRAQAERMNAASWYWLVITPEGTRGYRPNWKSGFYHLALEAKVPLVLVSLDYPNKVLDFTQHLWLTGDQEQDLAAIRSAYAGRLGKHPENAAPIELGERRKEPRG